MLTKARAGAPSTCTLSRTVAARNVRESIWTYQLPAQRPATYAPTTLPAPAAAPAASFQVATAATGAAAGVANTGLTEVANVLPFAAVVAASSVAPTRFSRRSIIS